MTVIKNASWQIFSLLPLLAFDTYPATLAPRDEKSSHPFSEETSSELVWLVMKNTIKLSR